MIAALLAGSLTAHAALAQKIAPGLEPHTNLEASLTAPAGQERDNTQFDTQTAEIAIGQANPTGSAAGDKLFTDPEPIEKGWKGLAGLLEALTPSVDTAIPLTPSQITSRISAMLDRGENQQALDIIEKRMAQRAAEHAMGTDVQLLFLQGRALAALNRSDEAIEVYLTMTTLYPELPEPWNNLAAEYVKQDKLAMARDALQMALTANPDYADGKANMGRVQLMLASESFDRASQLGVSEAGSQARKARSILEK